MLKQGQALLLFQFLMYNIASWKVRGMNQPPKQKEVRQIVSENKLCICAVLESHVDSSRLKDLCSRVFFKWHWISNANLCVKGPRIILGWDPNVVDLMLISLSDQVIHSQVFLKDVKKTVMCSFIYAHNRYDQRRVLWDNLRMHKAFVHSQPWCIMGDFNAALSLQDFSMGCSTIDIAMREFKDCVEDIGVSDVNQIGLHFTWNQKPRGDKGLLKKIDRIMANSEFMDTFVGAVAVFQPYRTSDHSPAILRLPLTPKFVPKPFKFSNVLVHHDNFKQVVSSAWEQEDNGYFMFRVVKNLKSLKKPLRKLLIDKGNLHTKVNVLRSELDEVQRGLDLDPFNSILREEHAAYLKAYNDAVLDEERFLKQKAKVEWLKVGDSNSAFFHKTVKSRVTRSRIDAVTDLDGKVLDGENVTQAFITHYTRFLGHADPVENLNIVGLFSNRLSQDQAIAMTTDVTDTEVREAIFSMGDDKSPGPDGFSACFFKAAWDTVGLDVTRAVKEFFLTGNLLKELNHTVIALIPKVKSPSKVTDYRPIALCNVIFKCITKILSNRMKTCLHELVSDNQSAFVPGRRITDNILLTQELMHNYHLDRGAPRCAFKVDIQKAYDTVDWSFLRKILLGFGFHMRMVSWIMECVTTTTFSLSINGSLNGYFKGKRGLRQGDPLSPYLFTLVMEVLTLIIKRQVRRSGRFLYHKNCDEQKIINLCFADDLFLFLHGDVDSARVISKALDEFKLASGLVPSFPKSSAYFCNVLNHVKLSILSILPFEEGSLPVKYLGVPLITSRLRYRDCKDLLERVQLRIQCWRNRFLSFAGRLQLINSVVSSLHVYWSAAFILPAQVIQEIERMMRNFLWNADDHSRGKSKVAWEEVCLPKEEGGLGVRRIEPFNAALITTHIWNIVAKKDSLWIRWIHSYKLKGKTLWEVPLRGTLSWSWRKILQVRSLVRNYLWFEVGNGRTISAWYDSWCLDGPIANIVSSRTITSAGFGLQDTVADIIVDQHWRWPSHWNSIFHSLSVPVLDSNLEDKLKWKDKNANLHDFSVMAAWEDLRPRQVCVSWYRLVWFPHNIPKHGFILWLVFKRRLKTQDLMTQWDVNAANMPLSCPLCEMQMDSHNHLFFECPFSTKVWNSTKVKAELHNIPSDWDSIIAAFAHLAQVNSVKSVVAKLVLAATVYFIWQERNSRLFRKQKRNSDQLVGVIIQTIRLKLLTCRFKKTRRVERFLTAWDLPFSLIRH